MSTIKTTQELLALFIPNFAQFKKFEGKWLTKAQTNWFWDTYRRQNSTTHHPRAFTIAFEKQLWEVRRAPSGSSLVKVVGIREEEPKEDGRTDWGRWLDRHCLDVYGLDYVNFSAMASPEQIRELFNSPEVTDARLTMFDKDGKSI